MKTAQWTNELSERPTGTVRQLWKTLKLCFKQRKKIKSGQRQGVVPENKWKREALLVKDWAPLILTVAILIFTIMEKTEKDPKQKAGDKKRLEKKQTKHQSWSSLRAALGLLTIFFNL